MKMYNCILLVDDDPINNFLNLRILNKLQVNKHIEVVNNGQEAIRFIENYCTKNNQCPELIFLDINMPVMNGLEFLKVFSALHFNNIDDVKIIMLTTSNQENDIEKARQYNIKDYLIKPLTLDKVRKILE